MNRLIETQHARRRFEHRLCVLLLCLGVREARKQARKQERKDLALRRKITRKYASDLDPIVSAYMEA